MAHRAIGLVHQVLAISARPIDGTVEGECRKQGVRFCVYYSILDWHNSDWGKRRQWNDVASGEPDMDRYTAYMKAQLKGIARYRPGVIWFDGEWESPWTHERGVDLYHYLRALDPDLIINNRVDVYRSRLGEHVHQQRRDR